MPTASRCCPLEEYLEKLHKVLETRKDLVVVARTDATDEHDILHRAEQLAATDADVVLVDGVRSVEWIKRIRKVVGDKPLLFNQIAGGKSPRLSLGELSGPRRGRRHLQHPVPVRRARGDGLRARRPEGGRRPAAQVDPASGVGVKASTSLLERNIARERLTPEGVGV